MRRILMFNRVSADGCFAAADGSLDWVVPDQDLDQEAMGSSPGTDTVLFGRRTYEMFEAFWPGALDESPTGPNPHGEPSQAMRAMALFLNEATKLVFSRTRAEVTWQNSHLLREINPADIAALKREPGKDMIIFGSGSVVSELSRHGLIDEYQFVVAPVLLGSGRHPVSGLSNAVRLELVEARPYRSGNVMLRYARQA